MPVEAPDLEYANYGITQTGSPQPTSDAIRLSNTPTAFVDVTIPEPSTALPAGLALLGLCFYRRPRR